MARAAVVHLGRIVGEAIASTPSNNFEVTWHGVLSHKVTDDQILANVWHSVNGNADGAWTLRAWTSVGTSVPKLRMTWTDGVLTTTRSATVPIPRPPRSKELWIKVFTDLITGDTTFSYKFSSVDSFTTIEVVPGAIRSMQQSDLPLTIGSEEDNTRWRLTGATYDLEVKYDGVTVANPVFSAENESTTNFTDATGMSWTLLDTAHIVEVTNNLGLAKPTNSFIARHLPDGVLQYNEAIASLVRQSITQRYSYTPEIVNRNGASWDFTGLKDGQYLFLPGNFIAGYVTLKITTLNISQSGIVCITPPIPYIDLDFHNVIILGSTFPVIGDGVVIDNTGRHYPVSVVAINQIGTDHLLFAFANPGKGGTQQYFEEDDPFQFFDGDRISFNFFYKLRDVT